MKFIENIRQKSYKEKMRVIWMVTAVLAIILIGVWILSTQYYKDVPRDQTLFQSISNGIRDVKNNLKK